MSNRSFSCMCHQALVCFAAMLWVFGFAAAAAHAEEPTSSAQKSEPEDTAKTNVVSEPTLGSLYTKARNASVLSESELSSGRGLPSAVSSVPGVFLQETNVGAGSPLFRGRVGIENAVRVDGLRYGNASFRTGPNQYLNVLDSQSFEAGMAVLGAGGTQFGVGATGGALLLRTFQGRDSSWGRVIGTGRTGDRALGLSAVGGVGGDAGYGFIGASLLNAGELRQAGESVAAGTGYRRSGGHFGAGVNLGDTGWSLNTRILRNEVRDVTRADKLGKGQARGYDNGDWFGYVDARGPVGEDQHRLRIAVMFQETEETVNRWSCDQSLSFYSAERCARHYDEVLTDRKRNRDRVLTLGGKASLDLFLWEERWDSTVGVEAYHDEVKTSTRENYVPLGHYFSEADRGNFQEGTTALDWSLYWMNELALLNEPADEVSLVFGARGQGLMANAEGSEDTPGADYSFLGVTGELGLSWLAGDHLEVFTVAASGFRAPNLQETTVLGDTGNFFEVPNPDLTPEDIYSFEVGLVGKGSFGRTGVTGHSAWVMNSIDRLPATYEGAEEVDGQEVRARENVGQSQIIGVEWWGTTEDWNGLGLFGDFSWLRVDVEREGGVVPGRRETPMNGHGGVFYARGDVYAKVFTRFALQQTRLHPDDRKDLRICEAADAPGELQEDCSGSPAWATLNVSLDTRLSDVWHWSLGVDNLTDHRYRFHGSGFDAGGVQAWTTATANF